MISAGDEAQVQFATVGVRPHLSGPRGSLASPGGRSAFRAPGQRGAALHHGPTPAAGTVMTPASSGEASRLWGGAGTVHLAPWDAFVHSLVTHLRRDGCDLQTDQELLGPRT
jgi:hypothetical protein